MIAILSWTVIIVGVLQVERQVKKGRKDKRSWVKKVAKDWKGTPYVLIALAEYLIDLIKPSTSSWPTMAAFYCTICFYVMEPWFNAKETKAAGAQDTVNQHSEQCQDDAVKESRRVEKLESGEKPRSDRGGGGKAGEEDGGHHMPKRIQVQVLCLMVLVLFWAACGVIKLVWHLQDQDSVSIIPYALVGLSSLEVVWLGAFAASKWLARGASSEASATSAMDGDRSHGERSC
ncbi:hypothetical protein FA13DRAFT_834463 [Coprinellus micaceus]|uniref:Uncharacterized protein n=1 Tax=Coprinellus micaceus TaxID=71717 RepID=A0A4Y7S306_COPMI|nr:hypothetical protein FA13DRAFT_834463 [Coprinellus micaceus]